MTVPLWVAFVMIFNGGVLGAILATMVAEHHDRKAHRD